MADKRPPRLSTDEREKRRGGMSPIDRLGPQRPWLHELYGDLMYRWLDKNRLMRNDDHAVEITYRARRTDDVDNAVDAWHLMQLGLYANRDPSSALPATAYRDEAVSKIEWPAR